MSLHTEVGARHEFATTRYVPVAMVAAAPRGPGNRGFQALLRQGAVVPEQPPVLRLADRGPAIAVALTAIGIAVFIVVLFVMYG